MSTPLNAATEVVHMALALEPTMGEPTVLRSEAITLMVLRAWLKAMNLTAQWADDVEAEIDPASDMHRRTASEFARAVREIRP